MEKQSLSCNNPPSHSAFDINDLQGIEETTILNQPSGSRIETTTAGDEEYKNVTGFKLTIVMISVTPIAFLIMLDTSIVSTVCLSPCCSIPHTRNFLAPRFLLLYLSTTIGIAASLLM